MEALQNFFVVVNENYSIEILVLFLAVLAIYFFVNLSRDAAIAVNILIFILTLLLAGLALVDKEYGLLAVFGVIEQIYFLGKDDEEKTS